MASMCMPSQSEPIALSKEKLQAWLQRPPNKKGVWRGGPGAGKPVFGTGILPGAD